jgi:hypothetical protein
MVNALVCIRAVLVLSLDVNTLPNDALAEIISAKQVTQAYSTQTHGSVEREIVPREL